MRFGKVRIQSHRGVAIPPRGFNSFRLARGPEFFDICLPDLSKRERKTRIIVDGSLKRGYRVIDVLIIVQNTVQVPNSLTVSIHRNVALGGYRSVTSVGPELQFQHAQRRPDNAIL